MDQFVACLATPIWPVSSQTDTYETRTADMVDYAYSRSRAASMLSFARLTTRASTTASVEICARLRSHRATSTQFQSGLTELTRATGLGKPFPRPPLA